MRELGVLNLRALGQSELGGELLDLLLVLIPLRLGPEGVREPAGDVPHRFQRLAGALLDRREDLRRSPAARCAGGCSAIRRSRPSAGSGKRRRAARALRVVAGLACHARCACLQSLAPRQVAIRSQPNSVDAGCVNSCSNGGSPRIPPKISRTPPPRRLVATRRGARASASRDASALRSPAAATRLQPT